CASSDGCLSVISYVFNKNTHEGDGYWIKHSIKGHMNGATCLSWEKPFNYILNSNKHIKDSTSDIISSFKLVSGGYDNQVIVWIYDNNTKEFHKLFQMNDKPHTAAIKDVSWRPNINNSTNIIASCSDDKQVIIWKEEISNNKWKNEQVIKLENKINKLSWSPNGTILAVACVNNNAYLYKENIKGVWEQICNLSDSELKNNTDSYDDDNVNKNYDNHEYSNNTINNNSNMDMSPYNNINRFDEYNNPNNYYNNNNISNRNNSGGSLNDYNMVNTNVNDPMTYAQAQTHVNANMNQNINTLKKDNNIVLPKNIQQNVSPSNIYNPNVCPPPPHPTLLTNTTSSDNYAGPPITPMTPSSSTTNVHNMKNNITDRHSTVSSPYDNSNNYNNMLMQNRKNNTSVMPHGHNFAPIGTGPNAGQMNPPTSPITREQNNLHLNANVPPPQKMTNQVAPPMSQVSSNKPNIPPQPNVHTTNMQNYSQTSHDSFPKSYTTSLQPRVSNFYNVKSNIATAKSGTSQITPPTVPAYSNNKIPFNIQTMNKGYYAEQDFTPGNSATNNTTPSSPVNIGPPPLSPHHTPPPASPFNSSQTQSTANNNMSIGINKNTPFQNYNPNSTSPTHVVPPPLANPNSMQPNKQMNTSSYNSYNYSQPPQGATNMMGNNPNVKQSNVQYGSGYPSYNAPPQ
ncbi:protein transport protein SEC13, partial [Hepatocystis sp. ex Piliocolobus tephrosceles]